MAADHSPPTTRLGVAGHPVAHSLSPRMHKAAYEALGIAADYQLLPIPPELFDETVRALPASGFRGINVTIPHKHAALEVADTASDAARAIGAANTLTFANGAIAAENTDAPGLLQALQIDPAGKRALVLGAGGTARAAVYALTNAGAAVSIWNRTPDRASTLAGEFGAEQIAKPSDRAPDAAIVVNTTAAGMETDDARSVLDQLQLDLNALADGAVLVDYPYKSGGSSLTLFARESGVTVVDGLDLLVGQGALSFELWFGRSAPRDVMRAAIG